MNDAIMQAGRVRMRPVLMTALTTILAMLPLALGLGESGASWAPMARSVMGGLATSIIFTLLVIPVIYSLLEGFAEKRKRKKLMKAEAKLNVS
jgi:HAE1 family hydrophobic/amphiphilic exporter-1